MGAQVRVPGLRPCARTLTQGRLDSGMTATDKQKGPENDRMFTFYEMGKKSSSENEGIKGD